MIVVPNLAYWFSNRTDGEPFVNLNTAIKRHFYLLLVFTPSACQ